MDNVREIMAMAKNVKEDPKRKGFFKLKPPVELYCGATGENVKAVGVDENYFWLETVQIKGTTTMLSVEFFEPIKK